MDAAIAILNGSPAGGVNGTVLFTQASACEPVGLAPNSLHGAHVHEFGNLTDGCASSGGHFNPFNSTHGAPDDDVRHVGDLGNLQADADGIIEVKLEDLGLMSLFEMTTSVVGRTLVIHGGEDDLGKGGNEASLQNGNSGARVACGIIVTQAMRNA
ncbi:Cu/Zn superoxide dismutase [Cylindrobasidium torrendii FP15055 ss-10]|uniref:Superoxide dismutase [Cu-Zn] n=1 Tax=Cylindrobasidium torrendii FP15055 ss-10 TaxID=1314674 RepID=A0A0D7B0Z6_9AGAR|nr:Cu/Zn superoxide dismutase [Cylindrobasidium torrendii FP15055 ss-10]